MLAFALCFFYFLSSSLYICIYVWIVRTYTYITSVMIDLHFNSIYKIDPIHIGMYTYVIIDLHFQLYLQNWPPCIHPFSSSCLTHFAFKVKWNLRERERTSVRFLTMHNNGRPTSPSQPWTLIYLSIYLSICLYAYRERGRCWAQRFACLRSVITRPTGRRRLSTAPPRLPRRSASPPFSSPCSELKVPSLSPPAGPTFRSFFCLHSTFSALKFGSYRFRK